MTRRSISWDEVVELIATRVETAFRLELQPVYRLDEEQPDVERFVAGDLTRPEFPAREQMVATSTAQGRAIQRIRVIEDPPTAYQRWLLWFSQWTIGAGEHHQYVSRAEAVLIARNDGLPWVR
jgi:hypothetical protein